MLTLKWEDQEQREHTHSVSSVREAIDYVQDYRRIFGYTYYTSLFSADDVEMLYWVGDDYHLV